MDLSKPIQISAWQSAALAFAGKMLVSCLGGFITLCFLLAIVARLDVAFFESNGMIQNEELREAFYFQIFDVDAQIVGMVLGGVAALAVLSFLFSKSQFDYLIRLHSLIVDYSQSEKLPSPEQLSSLGPMRESGEHFFKVLQLRLQSEGEVQISKALDEAKRDWPRAPAVSWRDQAQFAFVAGSVSAFFAVCCAIFHMKVSSRVVELATHMIRFSSATGPSFFQEQFALVNLVVILILGVMIWSAAIFGYRFSRLIAEADYAVLRDLRGFMEGNFSQRLFLRAADPAKDLLPAANAALGRLELRLRDAAQASPTEQSQSAVR